MNSPTKDSKIVMRGEKGRRIDEKNFKMEYTLTIVIDPESCQDRRAFIGKEQFDVEIREEMIRLVDEFLESLNYMLAILGDVHSFYALVVNYSKIAHEAGCSAMIQVGDFGMSWMDIQKAKGSSLYPHIPVYVIAGNHEDFDQWQDFEGVKEVMHNVFFVQKGHIMKLDDLNVLFVGGASSIDKKWQGSSWDWREDIQPSDVVRFQKNYAQLDGNIDLMIAHVPPKGVIDRNFDPKQKLAFDVPIYWQDKSAPIIEQVWKQVGEPQLFCGHMHRKVVDGKCQILDINEMIFYPKALPLSAKEASEQSKNLTHLGLDRQVVRQQQERLADLEKVRNSRIIPPFDEPKEWIHPMVEKYLLTKDE